MRIIPAIDIIDGQCVRLMEGDFNRKSVYSNNPVEIAKSFEDAGLKFLHLVDLDGAKASQPVNLNVLEGIARATNLVIDFGGGISKKEHVALALNAGASQINIGSLAIKNPKEAQQIFEDYGGDTIILSADVRGSKVAIDAWRENSDTEIKEVIKSYLPSGLKYVVCTDISKDGTLSGPSSGFYASLLDSFDIQLIASGGVSTISDLEELKLTGVDGAIIGKAIYEGNISLKELSTLC